MNKISDMSLEKGSELHDMVVTSMFLLDCHIIKLVDTQGADHSVYDLRKIAQ